MKQERRRWFNATAAYALLHIVCWGFYAVTMGFSSNVLHGFGFTDSKISVFLGICTALSCIAQLVLAEVVSQGKCKLWKILTAMGGLILVGNLLLLLPGVPRAGAELGLGLAVLLLLLLPALVNAVGMEAIHRGSPTNYSIARGIGSLGYSALAFATGTLVRQKGLHMVAFMGALCALALAVGAVWYHMAGEQNLCDPVAEPKQEKNGGFLRRYPMFAAFLLGSVFLQYSHNLVSNFLYQIMVTKQGTAQEQGIAAAICAFVELPVMFGFPLMARRCKTNRWVAFSGLFMAMKPIGLLLAANPMGVYLAQATQMLGYGLYVISSVNYGEQVAGRGDSVRAQSYLGAACTLGNLLAMSSGGFLCQHFGVPAMVLTSLGAALAGGILTLLTARDSSK